MYEDKDVFTVDELALYLGCKVPTVRKYVRLKKIPFYRVGRKILFRRTTIDNWIARQEQQNSINL